MSRGSSLYSRLILMAVSIVVLVVTLTSIYFTIRSRDALEEATQTKTDLLEAELEKRGRGLARNISLSSERAIAVMEYLFLEEVVSTTVKNDDGVVYGIIMDKNRRALVSSDPERANKTLSDGAAMFAANQDKLTSQKVVLKGTDILEVVAPITVAGDRWGTLRLGMSLEPLRLEIERSRNAQAAELQQTIVTVVVTAVLLAFLGSLVGMLAAGRIAQPLKTLMSGVNRLSLGDFDQTVEVSGSSEFVELAESFNAMTTAVKDRDAALRQSMTDLRQALEEAEEANRLKSEFLANISHELRTPLNAIINVPTSLLREYEEFDVILCENCGAAFQPDEETQSNAACVDCGHRPLIPTQKTFCLGDAEEHRHFLRRLQQQGQHLLSVVNDLLDFSKLEAGKMQLHPQDLETGQIFSDIGETVGPLATEKGVELVFDAKEGDRLMVDPVKLAQVLINLVGNAVKFTEAGGTITVSAEPSDEDGGDWMLFDVRDTGMGIPPDKLEVIFESFRQVDGSHTRAHGGTGLGLAITKQLVELHGGRIRVDSRVGQGSTFTFLLPLMGPEVEPEQRSDAGRGRTVMVIDDNEVHLELTKAVLEKEGYRTLVLRDATQAIERIEVERPDLIILDVMMPEKSGISILQDLRGTDEFKDTPVIVATAYHSNKEVVALLGAHWLPKPWDGADLLQTVDAVVRKAREG